MFSWRSSDMVKSQTMFPSDMEEEKNERLASTIR